MSGTMSGITEEVFFKVFIRDVCSSAFPLNEAMEPQKYVIGSMNELRIDIVPWKDSEGGNTCGAIEYSAIINDKQLDNTWIKFDSVSKRFSVKTDDFSLARMYKI